MMAPPAVPSWATRALGQGFRVFRAGLPGGSLGLARPFGAAAANLVVFAAEALKED